MSTRARQQAGFTLIESLIATIITVTVTAGVFAVLDPSHGLFRTQPEVADIQQRLRAGVDTLRHDLMMAGAGAYVGAQPGSLVGYFAPVLPFRQGSSAAYDDGVGVFKTDAVTIVYVPPTSSQTTIRAPLTDASAMAEIVLSSESGCPVGDLLCGFKPNQHVVVYDGTGAFDTFAVNGVDAGGTLDVQHTQRSALSTTYPPGSKIAEVVKRTYFIDSTNMQLMRYDGLSSASGILDNVVRLDFEYYGEPNPPTFRNPGVDQSVTYGPPPPALDAERSPWPPGENCTWQTIDGEQVTRLAALSAAGPGLVKLTPAQLTDGPWCPDAGSANRYDADLLRIRKIRVTIRLQTGNAALRGALTTGTDALFVNAGTATNAAQTVSDRAIRFDVSPRNMNLGR